MRPADTSLGGSNRGFPDTSHGLVSGLGASDARDYEQALESLCRRYWKPIYVYLRAAWAKGDDEAKDLVQAFMLWLFESGALREFDATRGTLRGYLKVLLKSFVIRKDQSMQRLKRGGGVAPISLEGLEGIEQALPDPRSADPEDLFERAWRLELLEQAIGRVRARYAAAGRARAFSVFEGYDLADGDRPTYRELAVRLGMAEGDIKKFLFEVREELRTELLAELSRMTAAETLRHDEWRRLFEA